MGRGKAETDPKVLMTYPMLGKTDFARVTRVSRTTVNNWIKTGRIKHIKIGDRKVMIPTDQIDVILGSAE